MEAQMTTEPQADGPEQTDHPTETDQPNEFGFAGGATVPQPQPNRGDDGDRDGENIAVPAGDLTGAITDSIDDLTEHRDEA
jgi:hypothetical protein